MLVSIDVGGTPAAATSLGRAPAQPDSSTWEPYPPVSLARILTNAMITNVARAGAPTRSASDSSTEGFGAAGHPAKVSRGTMLSS